MSLKGKKKRGSLEPSATVYSLWTIPPDAWTSPPQGLILKHAASKAAVQREQKAAKDDEAVKPFKTGVSEETVTKRLA